MAQVMPSLLTWAREEFSDLQRVVEDDSQFNWLVARGAESRPAK